MAALGGARLLEEGFVSVDAVWDLPKKSNFEGFRFPSRCCAYLICAEDLSLA